MKRVYTASNLPDAHIVADMLRHAGFSVQIFNVNAAGAIGELPVDAALPQVWLENENDEIKARALIDRYMHSAVSHSVKACNECGEENPLNFELCWSCGKTI